MEWTVDYIKLFLNYKDWSVFIISIQFIIVNGQFHIWSGYYTIGSGQFII